MMSAAWWFITQAESSEKQQVSVDNSTTSTLSHQIITQVVSSLINMYWMHCQAFGSLLISAN